MTRTFTKKAVKWLLIIGCINATLPFVLSAFGRDPVSDMGIAWITSVIAVILGYLIKSFKENKQRGIQRHEDLVAGIGDDDSCECTETIDETMEENEL